MGENYTLTVPGNVEYNGSSVQCKARVVGGGIIESSLVCNIIDYYRCVISYSTVWKVYIDT